MRIDLLAQRGLTPSVGCKVLAEMHAAQFSDTLKLTQAPRALLNLAKRYAIAAVLTIDEIRRLNLTALITEAQTAAALSARSGISASLISQWKNGSPDSKTGKPRQISSDSCRRLESAMDKAPGWMDHHDWKADQHTPEGVIVRPVDHDVIHPKFEDEPTTCTWEFILTAGTTDLPPRFSVTAPDDALAPVTPRGTGYLFATGPTPPVDGTVVIVQAGNGRRYMRLFFAGRGSEWEARARDPAHRPLHSVRDELTLLASATHRAGGQG